MRKSPLAFTDMLPLIEGVYDGRRNLMNECIDDAFEKTVKRALATGKVAKLTVTLTFERYSDEQIEVSGQVDTKLPNPKPTKRNLYHDERGNLHKADPNFYQPDLPNQQPLKKIAGGKA